MNFIKKYYPMAISIIFIDLYSLLIGATLIDNLGWLENNLIVGIIFTLLIFALVIGIWTEIILFMIHAGKNKQIKNNILWAVLIYFLNIFIIPYYNLKYVIKDKNVAVKMIIFVILLILSVYFSIISSNFLPR